MKGRAYELVQTWKEDVPELRRSFMMARLILVSRVVPEAITPELDDPEVERRLERAIATIREGG